MALIKKQRGRVTYYTSEGNRTFSQIVTEELGTGDLRVHFVGMTGAHAATNELGLEDIAVQDPEREIPRVFDTWEKYLKDEGICDSLADLDFLEVHSFGAAPKAVNMVADPEAYARERKRIRDAYSKAYVQYWAEHMPDNGLPARFTVYLEDLPDREASYELCATALLQRGQ